MVNRDFSDLFAALNDAGVKYLVIGAHAVAFHAEPKRAAARPQDLIDIALLERHRS